MTTNRPTSNRHEFDNGRFDSPTRMTWFSHLIDLRTDYTAAHHACSNRRRGKCFMHSQRTKSITGELAEARESGSDHVDLARELAKRRVMTLSRLRREVLPGRRDRLARSKRPGPRISETPVDEAGSRLRREVLPGRQDLLARSKRPDPQISETTFDDAVRRRRVATSSRSPARQAGPTGLAQTGR